MEADPQPAVIAIDPGSEKCGVAVVRRDGVVAYRAIVPTAGLTPSVAELATKYRPAQILCGRGTGSKSIIRALEDAGLEAPILPVDEAYTSEEARRRYVAEHPPHGLERLLPKSLRTPNVPYDDYVAVILAERYWRGT
ncbi:MAG TPA: hypothetical protein VKT77_06340 [Chthonomonadaceae bacterium]|nr:hypothetical protein [Chthonomonadaceae bacterium]